VSNQYGVRDAACPVSTRGGGEETKGTPPMHLAPAPPPPPRGGGVRPGAGTNRWEATDCEHADLPDDTISISIQCGTSSAENPLDTGTPPRWAPVQKRHLADCRGRAVTRYSVRLEVDTRKPSAAQSCDHNRHGGALHS